jgi:2-phosphoglycerate kinase
MITHSLVARGFTFEEAYQVAEIVRDKVKQRKVIERSELSLLIQEIVKEKLGRDYVVEQPAEVPTGPTIVVTGRSHTLNAPFSKGLLAQSLQASGLEPAAAYEISQQIETSLWRNGERQIRRDQLRRVIYQTILAKYDPKFAERYLLWRYFKAPDKPLVILFGGATGTGKSTIATEVAHRLGIQRILATDTVRQIMRMMFSRDLLPAIHYSSYEAWRDRAVVGLDDETAVVDAFREQATRVLVGVRAMVERAIQENFSLVVEGVHIVPGLLMLEPYEKDAYIVPLVISTLNRENYLDRFPVREKEAQNRTSQRYRKNFDKILQIQDHILEMAEHYETPFVENVHLDQAVAQILTIITNAVREKLKISPQELIDRALKPPEQGDR